MEIRKTTAADLDKVMDIYAYARTFMADHGNPTQWGTTEPPRALVEKDIEEGKSYVCVEEDEIAAVFYYARETDDAYAEIYEGTWPNEEPYGVVHRIASAGTVKGAGSFCLNWAYNQCKNLRIDTHRNNVVMQNLLGKNGFAYCGIIYIKDGTERLAYQKERLHD